MTKSPEKVFKSFDFISISENSLISLIERDDLQMKETEIWEHVLKWGLAKNPNLVSDPDTWSDNDFKAMEVTLQHCLPLIRFFSLSSEEFTQKIRPYKKLLKPQLYDELFMSYLDPNIEPSKDILLPRSRNIEEIIDSKIVNLNIVSLISRWIDRLEGKYAYTRELYLPFKFKLLLRGSRDGFTPKKFHKLCDNIPYTVTFIKIKGTEEIIGGFNPLVWKGPCYNEEYGKTPDSFIFSFKSKSDFRNPILSRIIHMHMNYALFYHAECGPSFYGDLLIGVKSNSKVYNNNVCTKLHYEREIRDTKENFLIEDYEVFKITKID
jgi:hypothetical protein